MYSFFNRELAPLANDMVDLLRSCNAWVDPNLVALVPGGAKDGTGESKRKRRKRHKSDAKSDGPEKTAGGKGTDKSDTGTEKRENNKPDTSIEDSGGRMEDSEDDFPDDFPDLAPNRIVLKRAKHVADSDSEDDSSS